MRLLVLSLLLPLAAAAQAPAEYSNLVGAGVRSRPAYDGSKAQRGDLVPLLDYDQRLLFARSVQGVLEAGAHTSVGSGFKLGVQLAYEAGRKASEASFLRQNNVPDIGVGASMGAHVEWAGKIGPAPLLVLARWRQQTQSDRGAQADLRATVGIYQSGPLQAGLFGQATWATQKSLRTYYGAPGFDPSGGPLFVSAGVLGSYDLNRRWAIIASLEGRRLQGDAARSPLAERKSNAYAVAGLGYRF